jgi:hypothetical protein
MYEYILIGLVVVGVIAFVPPLRRIVLSLIGLAGIVTAGVAVVAGVVWALYQGESWLASRPAAPDSSASAEVAKAGRGDAQVGQGLSQADDLEQRLLDEEKQAAEKEQQALEDARRHTESVAEKARAILEADRAAAALALANAPSYGLVREPMNIIEIRIPAWRDDALAGFQAGLIRSWLHAIGLTPQETANIATAKGWGSLYDLWRTENPDDFARLPPDADGRVTGFPSALPSDAPEPESAPAGEPELDLALEPEPPPAARQSFPPPAEPAPVRRFSPPPPRYQPPAQPTRTPTAEREVGPFGF